MTKKELAIPAALLVNAAVMAWGFWSVSDKVGAASYELSSISDLLQPPQSHSAYDCVPGNYGCNLIMPPANGSALDRMLNDKNR